MTFSGARLDRASGERADPGLAARAARRPGRARARLSEEGLWVETGTWLWSDARRRRRSSSGSTAAGRCSRRRAGPGPGAARAGLREAATELPGRGGRARRLRGVAALLAPAPPLLRELRRADRDAPRRPRARCPACGAPALPAYRPGGDRARDRPRRIGCCSAARRAGRRGASRVLAGFVEPGETLEEAVRREVLEESGVEVDAGVLRGVSALAVPELADDRLQRACGGGRAEPRRRRALRRCAGSSAPRWRPPPPARARSQLSPPYSISRRLIDAWLATAVPGPSGPDTRRRSS